MALALQASKLATARKRPSSEGPPRPKDRSRAAQSTSPWPDNTAAVHERAASGNDEWTITAIVRQLEIDRAQIAMLKESVEGLHASRLQVAADMLDLSKKVDARDFEQSKHTISIANQMTRFYSEFKEDVGHMGALVTRVETLDAEVTKTTEHITACVTREANMVVHLEQLNFERPAEGRTIMDTFKAI
jgi:hypothetical protein